MSQSICTYINYILKSHLLDSLQSEKGRGGCPPDVKALCLIGQHHQINYNPLVPSCFQKQPNNILTSTNHYTPFSPFAQPFSSPHAPLSQHYKFHGLRYTLVSPTLTCHWGLSNSPLFLLCSEFQWRFSGASV